MRPEDLAEMERVEAARRRRNRRRTDEQIAAAAKIMRHRFQQALESNPDALDRFIRRNRKLRRLSNWQAVYERTRSKR